MSFFNGPELGGNSAPESVAAQAEISAEKLAEFSAARHEQLEAIKHNQPSAESESEMAENVLSTDLEELEHPAKTAIGSEQIQQALEKTKLPTKVAESFTTEEGTAVILESDTPATDRIVAMVSDSGVVTQTAHESDFFPLEDLSVREDEMFAV